jgi:thiol-disulfide isomerase/thioredoxin
MATRKFRKSRPRKTVRRRRYSTAGKILPPLDVRSNKHLREFEKRIKQGDLTIILVWAPWCPHCHTMMPHFDAAAKSPNRSIQAVKVEEKMLPVVNQVLTTNINKSAKPLNVEGYPSIIVVDKQGNKVTDIEPVRNTKSMTSLMENAGPLAEEAGLNKPNTSTVAVANSIKNSLKSNMNINSNNMANAAELLGSIPKNKNKPKNILANIGMEEEGLVSGQVQNMNINSLQNGPRNSPKNIDVGEEELKGSIASEPNKNKNIKLNSIPTNKLGNAGQPPKENTIEPPAESIAPSPLNTFNAEKNKSTAPPASLKKLSQEAEEITSLNAPISPPSALEDMETSQNVESISNSLTPEQKVSGGSYSRKGGSLYSAMARTTYTLAPAAALLATAAMVMKGKHRKSHKRSKKTRKTLRRRR